MVDLDDTYTSEEEDSTSSSSSGGRSSTSSESDSSSSGSAQPIRSEVDVDNRVKKANLSQTSKEWADKYGDLSHTKGASGSLKSYIQKQEKETRDFYKNMAEMGKEIADEGAQKFTLAHHAMILNMAHNRAGIKEILEDEFGKSQKEAIQITNRICKNAGEYKAFVEIMNKVAKDGLEVKDLEKMI